MTENLNNILAWLKMVPSWARIVIIALVAAVLAVLSFTSCAASAKVQREGVHIDTVRVDYIIRSRNIQNF